MPVKRDPEPHASARAALERCWIVGRRLAQARRRVVGTLPTSPERLVSLGHHDEERIDAFLFRLGAALTVLIGDAMEPVLLAEHRFMLFLDVAEDLRDLERCGAIASAETVLDIRERVWRHYLIAALAPEARAAALNEAWADGQMMLDLLVGLSSHIQRKGLVPGLDPFRVGPP